jgi:hypothetical protein
MKGDKLELITLADVEPCGLNVTDSFKGASSPENVEVYKRLEKPCINRKRRRAFQKKSVCLLTANEL